MFFLMTGLAFFATATSYPGEMTLAPTPEIELAVGYNVVDRRLVAVDGDNVFVDGETVVAWTEVVGMQAGFLQHVWYRDGIEVARHDLPVGAGRRWRSWSRHHVQPGVWTVRVLDAQGRELALTEFVVADPDADVDC